MAHQQESFYLFPPTMSLLNSSKLLTESSSSLLHHAFQLPKLHGKWSIKAYWFQPTSLLHLGLSSVTNLPLHPHFPQSATPVSTPTFFFQLFWASIVSPDRHGPVAWSQPSTSSQAGAKARGSCLPVTSWMEVTPIPLAQSKATAV